MRVLQFIAGLLVLHVAFTQFYLRRVVVGHEVLQRDAQFLNRPADVSVVIAGDSHPRMNVVPRDIPGAVNIATRGEDYFKNRYRLRWLLDQRGEGIEAVVLGFDAASFSTTRLENFRPEAIWGRYIPFLEVGSQFETSEDFPGKWLKAMAVPYAGEAETLGQWVTSRRQFRGKDQIGTVVATQLEWGDDVADRHFPPGSGWHPSLEASLRALIADLRARDIRVVLVSYPVTAEYAVAVEERGADQARRKAILDDLVEPGRVDHLDYETMGYGNRKLFGDADHLSMVGARLFTVKLRNDLVALGLFDGASGR